jgi:hypothetical protein
MLKHLVFAVAIAGLGFACDKSDVDLSRDKSANAPNSDPKQNIGGGPAGAATEENPTDNLHANGPAPAGSAANELPGMPQYPDRGEAMDSNGGSGAGTTGTKGVGATLTNGRNQQSQAKHPVPEESNLDGKKTLDGHH